MRHKIDIFARMLSAMLAVIVICAFVLPANAQNRGKTGIPKGFTVLDGDILVPNELVDVILGRKKKSTSRPEAVYQLNSWTKGIIPFEFNANVTSTNRSAMISAMSVLENVANVHFQQCPNDICIFVANNFVRINDSTGNNSQVGMMGGEQFINIFNWDVQFIMVHELIHCLGLFHEQSRPSRNGYVQINTQFISGNACSGQSCLSQFTIQGLAGEFGYYDFDSVMHYGQCAFTTGSNCPTDGTQTITVLSPNQFQQTLIGQRTHMSAMDNAVVGFIYPFDNWNLVDCTYNGSNGTPIGTFPRPYTTLADALANTPAGGTIWILKECSFPVGTYSNQVTIRAAPGVTATFEN